MRFQFFALGVRLSGHPGLSALKGYEAHLHPDSSWREGQPGPSGSGDPSFPFCSDPGVAEIPTFRPHPCLSAWLEYCHVASLPS